MFPSISPEADPSNKTELAGNVTVTSLPALAVGSLLVVGDNGAIGSSFLHARKMTQLVIATSEIRRNIFS